MFPFDDVIMEPMMSYNHNDPLCTRYSGRGEPKHFPLEKQISLERLVPEISSLWERTDNHNFVYNLQANCILQYGWSRAMN